MRKVINGENQIKKLYLLRTRIKELQEIEEKLTKYALTHLKAYGTLQQDEWAAVINLIESRRPKWKEEFIKECGTEKADKITQDTKPSVCEKVEIYKDGIRVNC
jgi:DNA polymerase/3'-5' exonuclease PolX